MDEKRGKKAFELDKVLKENEEQRRRLMMSNIHLLDEIFEEELYKEVLGDENAPWSAYLGQIETYYSRSEVKNLLRVYKKFSKELGLPVGDYADLPRSRLIEIIPLVNKTNVHDWIDKAVVLLSKDWKIEVRKAKGLPTEDDDHEHEFTKFEVCEICGLKIKDASHTH